MGNNRSYFFFKFHKKLHLQLKWYKCKILHQTLYATNLPYFAIYFAQLSTISGIFSPVSSSWLFKLVPNNCILRFRPMTTLLKTKRIFFFHSELKFDQVPPPDPHLKTWVQIDFTTQPFPSRSQTMSQYLSQYLLSQY